MKSRDLMRIFGGLVALAVLFDIVAATSPEARAAQGGRVKIGVVAPLSGEVAPWGDDVRRSISFAAERLGMTKGYEFVFEDDQCLGSKATAAAQKLISIDKVDFAMVVCTESMLVTAPVFERAKVTVIAPVASGKSVSKAGDYIFRTWPSDAAASELLYRYVSRKHHVFGVLTEERGYAKELGDAFLAAAGNGPLKLITEDFPSSTADFRSLLLRLRKHGIDGLFVNTNSEQTFANILKQQQDLGGRLPSYGVYIPGNEGFPRLTGELSEGIIFVDAPSAQDSLTTDGKRLYHEFLSRFGALRSASFVFPSTFEAVRLMQMTTESEEEARSFLYHGSFSGIFGDYSFDRNGDIVGVKHVLKVIEDGRTRLVGTDSLVLGTIDDGFRQHGL